MYYSQNIFLEGGTPSAYVILDFAKISKKLGGGPKPLWPPCGGPHGSNITNCKDAI